MAPSTDGGALDAATPLEPAPDAGPSAASHPPDAPAVWAVARRVAASSEHPGSVVARLSDALGAGARTGHDELGPEGDPGGGDVDGLEIGSGGDADPGDEEPAGTAGEAEEMGNAPATSAAEDRTRIDHRPEMAPDWQPEAQGESAEEMAPDWQPEAQGESAEEAAPDWQPEAQGESAEEAAPDTEPETEAEAEAAHEHGWEREPEPEREDTGLLDDDYGVLLAAAESVLDRVDRALARLDDGTYGTCEACGRPIDDDLLAADPTATTCEQHLRPVDRPI